MQMFQKYHRLGKRQLAVITDMFDNGLTKSQALQKNKVGRWLFRRWMKNHSFVEEYNSRIDEAMQQSGLIIAHFFPEAAKRLAKLITSEKDEVARKACLDLVSLRKADAVEEAAQREKNPKNKYDLTQEEAVKIWQVLAERNDRLKKQAKNPNPLNQNNL